MGIMSIMTLITSLVYKYVDMEIVITAQQFPLDILKLNLEMLIPIFSAILISDIITDEYRSGTLKLPLIHPVSRIKLLNAKIITILVILIVLSIFSLVISYVLGLTLLDWGDSFMLNGKVYSTLNGILITVGSHLASIIPLLAFNLIIIMISLKLESSGTVVGAAVGLIFGFNILIQLSETIRPYVISYYFNYYPILLKNTLSKETLIGLLVITGYGIGTYFVCLNLFNKKDIVY